MHEKYTAEFDMLSKPKNNTFSCESSVSPRKHTIHSLLSSVMKILIQVFGFSPVSALFLFDCSCWDFWPTQLGNQLLLTEKHKLDNHKKNSYIFQFNSKYFAFHWCKNNDNVFSKNLDSKCMLAVFVLA